MSKNIWSPDLIKFCGEKLGLHFSNDEESIIKASKDFGLIFQEPPTVVFFPESAHDLKALLSFANKNSLALTVRGAGYSQGGHTLTAKGAAIIDCSKMIKVELPNLEDCTIKCESGATWSSVIETTSQYGLIPKVIPFFPGLTVGGVLSIGGIGGNSHLYGCISGNVKELEVVTGNGEYSQCDKKNAPALFEAMLCGLGRCGVITSATLSLRKYKPHVKTFYLGYDNHGDWLSDQQMLARILGSDYLEAFCSPVPIGLHQELNVWKPLSRWYYTIQTSFEYEEEEPTESILDSLKVSKFLHSASYDTLSFLTRYAARANNLQKNGSWNLTHPWWECILSIETITQVLPQLLKKLPLMLGDGLGYRIFSINENCPKSFMKPRGTLAMGVASLPMGITLNALPQVLESLQTINEWLLPMGGKRYLSGWLGKMTPTSWEAHYGTYYPEWVQLKRTYDPNGILQSLLLEEIDSNIFPQARENHNSPKRLIA